MITVITISYGYAIKLQWNYKVGIIIIPEGHPCQNGNEMAAMILTYPPMYCPNNTSCGPQIPSPRNVIVSAAENDRFSSCGFGG
jgi:hypothetical protein